MSNALNTVENLLRPFTGTVVLVGVVAAIVWLIYAWLARLGRRADHRVASALAHDTRWPVLVLAEAVTLATRVTELSPRPDVELVLTRFFTLVVIAAAAWLSIRTFDVAKVLLLERYRIDVPDNLRARQVQTQFAVLRTIVVIVIVIVALGAMLLTFDSVRELGVGLLASAGIAGIIVAMAAQPLLGNILASLQIALTEPIRIDDVVIIGGEWGWIEEITLTYVVVRIWDLRRLVVPISEFTQKAFQNWTRVSADLIGSVILYVDYSVPVAAVRKEVQAALEASPLWDRKVWNLQVTDTTEHTMQLRALMSARNSGEAWDLRCAVRERLVDFLQREYPGALPRTRVALASDPREPSAVAARTTP
ncbi:MAG: mechanosensitive ion channel family protein [Thermoplasmatota archaeon]